jgi:hypothetical protein
LQPDDGRRTSGVAAGAVAKSCPKTSTVFAHASESSGGVAQTIVFRRLRWQATENDGLPYARFFW